MKQRTILREASLHGKGLHTGEECTLTILPAPEKHGIVFRRVDLYGKPELFMRPDGTGNDLVRQTTLSDGNTSVHTPEHLLSALVGCGIDNVIVELEGKECPILDGSARPYVQLIEQAGPVQQEAEREYLVVKEPVSLSVKASSLIALPYDGLKITCTSADDRGIHTQHLSLDINPEVYAAEIAPARTFTIYEDIEPLIKMGKIQGGSLDCAIVLKGDKVISREPLRFNDEFVRHKILDIIGDLALLGKPLKAHIVAVRPGHALNNKFIRAIAAKDEEISAREKVPIELPAPSTPTPAETAHRRIRNVIKSETSLDIRRVLDILPQSYPFVMIDRVIDFSKDDELVAIKNVTINEPFFQGHYPGNPVMPGVLQLEAMAQAAGIIMLKRTSSEGKVAFFMTADNVKFRRPVRPGDTLTINVKITRVKGPVVAAHGECSVGGKVVSSSDLLFTFKEASVLD
jgi:UDP-3-O-[3-hydroxymyristoyl] N-acetylglucosamine deacetylase / 3-hydroxyacyl-[acyl-carrier-protein] dehydratase